MTFCQPSDKRVDVASVLAKPICVPVDHGEWYRLPVHATRLQIRYPKGCGWPRPSGRLIPICRVGMAIREPHCDGISRTPWFSIIYVDITGSLVIWFSQHSKIDLLLTSFNVRASIRESNQGLYKRIRPFATSLRMVGNHGNGTMMMYCMYVRALISSGPITEYISNSTF
jgi:hypothetical protein